MRVGRGGKGGKTYLGGKVEVLAEVVNALRGEDILKTKHKRPFSECWKSERGRTQETYVVVLPREVGSEETPRGQRLASLDDEQVLDIEVLVLGSVEVLLGDEHTL